MYSEDRKEKTCCICGKIGYYPFIRNKTFVFEIGEFVKIEQERTEDYCPEHSYIWDSVFLIIEKTLPFLYKKSHRWYDSNVRRIEDVDQKALSDALFNLNGRKALELCYYEPEKEEWLKFIC